MSNKNIQPVNGIYLEMKDTDKGIKPGDQVKWCVEPLDNEVFTVQVIWACKGTGKCKCNLVRTVDLLDNNVKFKPITSTFVAYLELSEPVDLFQDHATIPQPVKEILG